MKKLLLILAASAATAGTTFAQAPAAATTPAQAGTAAPDQLAQRRAQYLGKELGLTADQQTRLAPILMAQRQQLQLLREQRTTGGRKLGTAQDLKANEARTDEQIKTVLTPEQFTKFAKMRDEQREKMREHRAAGANAPAGQP
jgi:Spy/CpxP family protein refolding chaperone